MSERTTESDAPVWCSEHMEPYCPRHAAEKDALGDRTRWFMAKAWEEGVRAGHECVGAEVRDTCLDNPYRVTPPN